MNNEDIAPRAPSGNPGRFLVRRAPKDHNDHTSGWVDLTGKPQPMRNKIIRAMLPARLRRKLEPVRAVPSRAVARAPRRAVPSQKTAAPKSGPDEPPAPRLVNQRSAAAVLGWPSRFYLEFIKRKSVPHVVVRRLHIARCDDILEALGLAPRQQVEAQTGPAYSREAQIIRLQAGARKRGSR
jgi:hypothetical protein